MNSVIQGIHHVTAIGGDPQRSIDFYVGLLGLRQVKKTVNFDDPSAYHFYYGDANGSPGSIVTFFYWPGGDADGRVGSGQATALVFSAAPASLSFWHRRLESHGVEVERQERFGEEVLSFRDPDGIPVEIVAVEFDARSGWDGAGVPQEVALRGLHAAELTVVEASLTAALLTEGMGFRMVRREGNRTRYEVGDGGSGRYADVIEGAGERGLGGVGTIHHMAWSVPDVDAERAKQAEFRSAGLGVSAVMDRDYFRSIYYREPGGILFELATAGPGFAVDEDFESLGTQLRLPRQHEALRAEIERLLPVVEPAPVLS
ncbi:glyoxalase family protein [Haloferula luteola]|uniref:Glyoxalase family protein n=1 Tax=Haloferula luteola TaxID=595692 RepID=A0A840VFU7_9BACT|nr:VOC family protein [Haloferula luteola]MBB5351671.1 glyoxalase family protein [Haloferula luteola]